MENDTRKIMPGHRVLVFDPRLFEDDISTPLSHTMKTAIVIRRYGYKFMGFKYPDLLDVIFDHDGRESCGHFTSGVKWLQMDP